MGAGPPRRTGPRPAELPTTACAGSRDAVNAIPQPASSQAAAGKRRAPTGDVRQSPRGDVRRDCGRSASKSDIGDPISFRAIRPLQLGRRRCLGLYRLCQSYELKGNPGFLAERLLTGGARN